MHLPAPMRNGSEFAVQGRACSRIVGGLMSRPFSCAISRAVPESPFRWRPCDRQRGSVR